MNSMKYFTTVNLILTFSFLEVCNNNTECPVNTRPFCEPDNVDGCVGKKTDLKNVRKKYNASTL